MDKLILISYTIIGAIITALIYGIFAYIASSGGGGESFIGLAFLIVMPLALFIGSTITGYLSCNKIKGLLGEMLISPGLYLAITVTVNNLILAEFQFALMMIVPALLWVIVSFFGVRFGIKRRNKDVNLTSR